MPGLITSGGSITAKRSVLRMGLETYPSKAQEWIGRVAVGYAAGISLESLCTFLGKCD
jgi:hypothetical protein